jgi:hypothetical protein
MNSKMMMMGCLMCAFYSSVMTPALFLRNLNARTDGSEPYSSIMDARNNQIFSISTKILTFEDKFNGIQYWNDFSAQEIILNSNF